MFKLYKVVVHIDIWHDDDIHYVRAASPERAILEVVSSLVFWDQEWDEMEVSLA
jgi:hypothetical protein